ncbi:Glutathione S-transferase kappa 1 [Lunasporangiospora selenospora]|uniref:Glutathione S-transferase kappa 1 n=1 Tax=Lunasporangiospora selenospora TaxID=979761 RepID=A0A9P6FTC5_9FUNG|nr:Glutathione S-transferase kappa 1 [Lunasporangiospora selenospora]
MNGSKNSPPLTVAAKGAYMPSDLVRISRATNIPLRFPSSFPSLTVSAMRLLIVIKEQEPAKFDQCVEQLYDAHWANDKDISQNEVLVTVLGPILGSMDKVEQYLQMASTPEIKKALTDNTNEALAKGAFGVPSFIVKRSSTDKEHLFFGSDRFELMSSFLDLPYQGLDPRSAML